MPCGLRAEIDLSAVRDNVRAIHALVGPGVSVMAVVKANAYGHGSSEVARAALQAGADWLGVATVDEGAMLRRILPDARIAVLAPFGRGEAEEIAVSRLTPFVSDLDGAEALSRAAVSLSATVYAHLEIDSGMGRSGVAPEDAGALAGRILALKGIRLSGLCSHFASADDDPVFTERQLSVFHQAHSAVVSAGAAPTVLHSANSAALVCCPAARLNLVRPGLLVYGIRPDVGASADMPPVRPALALKTSVRLVRRLPKGHAISYGCTHVLRRESRVATLRIGYGDGYPRALSSIGSVLVAGKRAPILGRVCMDVTVVDVTDIPEAEAGDEAVLVGEDGRERITVEEIADLIGTTYHDVTTRLAERVPRIYAN